MKTHRETYPEQYTHPLVGKSVVIKLPEPVFGIVERVVTGRYGQLAILEGKPGLAWLASDCVEDIVNA